MVGLTFGIVYHVQWYKVGVLVLFHSAGEQTQGLARTRP